MLARPWSPGSCEARAQENGDGPSKVLLDVMGAKKFISPDGWKGWRELTSK